MVSKVSYTYDYHMIIKTFPDECFFLASILVEIQKSVSQKTFLILPLFKHIRKVTESFTAIYKATLDKLETILSVRTIE